MKLIPLGVGSAYSTKYYHNNYVLNVDGKNLLIDAGTTLRYSLRENKLECSDINYIIITHFHFDHAGGLEEFLSQCYWRFQDGKHQPHRPMLLMLESQVDPFHRLLSPGLCNQGMGLADYCDIQIISNGKQNSFPIGPIDIDFIDTTNLHCQGMPSFGLKITDRNRQVNFVFSSDIKKVEESRLKERINEQTKAIFHDLQIRPNPVHCDLQQVLKYYPASAYSLFYAMHYPDDMEAYRSDLLKYGIRLLEQGVPVIL